MDKSKEFPKIGFIVNNLGPSQISYNLISQINKLYSANVPVCFAIFYENVANLMMEPNCMIMQCSEAWSYKGILISTSLTNANKLIRMPAAEKKYFYVWNIEWLGNIIPYYEPTQFVYSNPELHLIARNEDHATLIQNSYNRNVDFVVDDFDLVSMLRNIGKFNGPK